MVQDIHRRNHFIEALYDNPVGRVVTAGILATMIAAATVPRLLPRSNSIDFPNVPSIGRSVDSSQNTGQTVTDAYYTQARSAILQDVPDLANYQTALDYTAQRMVDMKNVYGLSLDEVRAPIAKWIQFNVDIDKKGERLIPLSEGTDFIPLNMADENETYDPQTQQHNQDIGTPARLKIAAGNSVKIPYAQMLANNIDSIIAGHDQIWSELQDPAKMREYMKIADGIVPLPFTEQEAAKYKSAIRQHGTFSDEAHWALVGRAWKYGISNEEITRNEVSEAMALAVGGDIRIERNEQLWDISSYKGTVKMRPDQGDRQPAFRKSASFKKYLAENQDTYGTQLDPDYLAPELPSLQAIQNAKGWVSPNTGIKLIGIQSVTLTSYTTGNGQIFPK